jgi:chromatin remodeling complex protein RSC6
MEKAYALRDAREAARLEYVQKCYNQQWRDACDDARTLDSKAMVSHMNQERLNQIAARRRKNEELSKQEAAWISDWKRQLSEMEEKDRQKDNYRSSASNDTMIGLKRQVSNLFF